MTTHIETIKHIDKILDNLEVFDNIVGSFRHGWIRYQDNFAIVDFNRNFYWDQNTLFEITTDSWMLTFAIKDDMSYDYNPNYRHRITPYPNLTWNGRYLKETKRYKGLSGKIEFIGDIYDITLLSTSYLFLK